MTPLEHTQGLNSLISSAFSLFSVLHSLTDELDYREFPKHRVSVDDNSMSLYYEEQYEKQQFHSGV